MIQFETLKLSGFRNFLEQDVRFVQGTNIIIGQNGQGKSNLLEALYLLCTGRSFRTSHLKELIHFDRPGFYLEATLKKQSITHSIKLELYPHKKKLTIDQTTHHHFHPLMGLLPVVIITPEMKKIIDGGPLERRKFIDFLASQLSRPYFESITRYHKALKQRNAGLKHGESTTVWEKLMAQEWLFIEAFRKQLVEKLELHANSHLRMNPLLQADIQLKLSTSLGENPLTAESLHKLFQTHLSTEQHLGMTLHGPHRDELNIYLSHKKAAITASEGQKKMLVVALCLASYDLLKEELQIDPLLLIDDYDAHFDSIRKDWVCSELDRLRQTFLTSPLNDLTEKEGTLHVHEGVFRIKDAVFPL